MSGRGDVFADDPSRVLEAFQTAKDIGAACNGKVGWPIKKITQARLLAAIRKYQRQIGKMRLVFKPERRL